MIAWGTGATGGMILPPAQGRQMFQRLISSPGGTEPPVKFSAKLPTWCGDHENFTNHSDAAAFMLSGAC